MQPPLKDRCVGKWVGILAQLGIDAKALTGRHGPCPMCGGRDRFRFDNREGRGTWICSQCGAGDGFTLLERKHGWDFKRAASEVERFVGGIEPEQQRRVASDKERRDALNRLWASGKAVQAGDPVSLYLNARLGPIVPPRCLRTALHIRYQEADGPATFHPVMLAMVADAQGRAVNLHRTYLTKTGEKAAVPSPRKMMPGPLPKGSAVRLAPHSGVLGIAEGIETALSASILFGVPVWAAVNANMLAGWWPPKDVQEVIVFGDNDPKFAGQAAAFGLAHRIACQSDVKVRLEIPPSVGLDWNDELKVARNKAA